MRLFKICSLICDILIIISTIKKSTHNVTELFANTHSPNPSMVVGRTMSSFWAMRSTKTRTILTTKTSTNIQMTTERTPQPRRSTKKSRFEKITNAGTFEIRIHSLPAATIKYKQQPTIRKTITYANTQRVHCPMSSPKTTRIRHETCEKTNEI